MYNVNNEIGVENTKLRLVNRQFNFNINSFAMIKSKKLRRKLKYIPKLFIYYFIHKVNSKTLLKKDLYEYRSYIYFCKYVNKEDGYTLYFQGIYAQHGTFISELQPKDI